MLTDLQPSDIDAMLFMTVMPEPKFTPARPDCDPTLGLDDRWMTYKMGHTIFWMLLYWQQVGAWIRLTKAEIIEMAAYHSSKEFAADSARIIELIEAGLDYLSSYGYVDMRNEETIIITEHLKKFLTTYWLSEEDTT